MVCRAKCDDRKILVGASNGDRNIHWKKWDKMTYSKSEGEYEFRELQHFNSALLANMAAQVLNEPNALWVRVLKGIYFSSTSFMHANKGGRVSWGWSSLLVGRDVIKADGVWCVWDGQTIRPFIDRWVMSRHDFRITQPEGS